MAARTRSAISYMPSSVLKQRTRRGPPKTCDPSNWRPDAHANAQARSQLDFARPPGATSTVAAPRIRSVPCGHLRFGGMSGRLEMGMARDGIGAGVDEIDTA